MARIGSALALVAIAALVLVLGVTTPASRAPSATDTLGPSTDETAADYLARIGPPAEDDGQERWALVSPVRSVRADEIRGLVGDVRVSVVYVHVPLDRVQTPLLTVAVPDTESVLTRAVRDAAGRLGPGRDARGEAVTAAVRSRLLGDCACVAGVLVRGTAADLRRVADADGVRGVEVAPPAAAFARLAVTPLWPEREGTAVVPDDGPVPPA
ncbi:hypothetical protein [Rhodococcoides corynebacterioides]|uniref:Secreted protein n=1 Tax=Rhodococcoides corynebacterioides TaxID=53972 RepID=A0ABS7P2W1_9NOCA|nr:hypothetical protein [Rhodococcus corynebacterioides]MBY6366730.1 hypothetical protein [Rhodococcus corynebacterioides]MBY6409319.1 hypothetical protein [Rhodococcus corynebacterioides]